MRTVLIVLLVLILGMATCGYLTYRWMKPQFEQMRKVPPSLEKPGVVTGEDAFGKEAFYKPERYSAEFSKSACWAREKVQAT